MNRFSENDSPNRLDIYDVADWLWSYRVVALIFFVLGSIGAVGAWLSQPVTTPSYRLSVTVFTSGTPLRTAAEIVEIVRAKLPQEHAAILTEMTKNPLVVIYPNADSIREAEDVVSSVEELLIEEVEQQAVTLTKASPTAAAENLKFRTDAFLAGYRSGLYRLVQTTMNIVPPRPKSLRGPFLLLVGCGFAFIGFASIHSFLRSWRSLRLTQSHAKTNSPSATLAD